MQDFEAVGDDELLGDWRTLPVGSEVPFSEIRPTQFKCQTSDDMFPTHPQQAVTKSYHLHQEAQYDRSRIDATHEHCEVSSVQNPSMSPERIARNIERARQRSRPLPCVRGRTAVRRIMSDIYMDRCGHFYRGIWMLSYQEQHESQGTLYSKGRTSYPTERENYYRDGNTYMVNRGDFLALAEVFDGDMDRITRYRQQALENGWHLGPDELLFIRDSN